MGLKLERMLVEKLIPTKNNVLIRSVFSQICAPVLQEFKTEIECIAKWATERVNRREYKEALLMMSIIDHIRQHTPSLSKLVSDCNQEVKQTTMTISDSLHKIGGRLLEEFVCTIKSDPDKDASMPRDGPVHALTSRAMLMVSNLDQYHEATTMMASAKNRGATFSTIVDDVIKAITDNLLKKSK